MQGNDLIEDDTAPDVSTSMSIRACAERRIYFERCDSRRKSTNRAEQPNKRSTDRVGEVVRMWTVLSSGKSARRPSSEFPHEKGVKNPSFPRSSLAAGGVRQFCSKFSAMCTLRRSSGSGSARARIAFCKIEPSAHKS